jgi:hypothetical protein
VPLEETISLFLAHELSEENTAETEWPQNSLLWARIQNQGVHSIVYEDYEKKWKPQPESTGFVSDGGEICKMHYPLCAQERGEKENNIRYAGVVATTPEKGVHPLGRNL